MLGYLLRRSGHALVVLWLAYTASFVLLFMVPSNPIEVRLNDPENPISPEDAARVRAYYGLDRPILEQYVTALGRLLNGDLGYSLQHGDAVSERMLAALPATLQLAGLGLVFAIVLAFALVSVIVLTKARRLADFLELTPSLFVSVPMFWLGLLVIQVFSFRLGWFSVIDDRSFSSLVFAALAIAIPVSAPLTQVLLAGLQSVYAEPFIDVLTTKGVGPVRVYLGHALRNSLMPLLTVLGLTVGELLAGAVVTETVFSRQGLGALTERAVTTQDLPVIQGVVLFAAVVFVAVNWVVDVIHPMIDPRVRRTAAGTSSAWTAPPKLVRSGV